MNSELKILKEIWQNDEKAPIRLIAKRTELRIDYIHYLCKCLFKKGQIKPVEGNRDWYQITSQGKQELKTAGLIRLDEKPSKIKRRKRSPKRLKLKKAKKEKRGAKPKKLKTSLRAEERKFDLGESIEKAVSFLKGFVKS